MKRNNAFSKGNFFIRILLPTILTIALFVAVLFALFIPHYENTIMDRKREMIKELTNSAWSIIDKWHKAERSGEVSKDKAQEMARSQIEGLRYGDELKDYFWITDYKPNMIMHPYRAELNNQDLNNFTDSRGKKLFAEMAELAKKEEAGFVDYMWQWKDDSTKIVSKLSYVKAFKPWQWIVGTGIYIEDVKNEIAVLETKILNASFGITLMIAVLLFFIAYQNLRSEKLRVRAEDDLQASKEKYRTLAEASSEGLIMILEEGQISFNKTLYTMLGYEENSPKLSFPELFVSPPKLKSFDLSSHQFTPLENNEVDQLETQIKKADGSVMSVLLNVSPISFLNSTGVVISIKDITLNKKIEAELGQSKEKYLSLTNKVSIGVFSAHAGKGGRFIESNAAVLNLLEIQSMDDLKDTSLAEYFEDSLEYESFYHELMQQQSVQNQSFTLRKSSGTKSAASISAVLIKDVKGEPDHIEGVIEDISVQSKSNKEREDLIQELETAFLFLNNSIEGFIKPLPVCPYQVSVKDAIACMDNEKCDCLLIVDTENNPMGLLTAGDVRRRILVSVENLQKKVFEFMSSPIKSISSTASVFEALSVYHSKNIKHLICRNIKGSIIGIISSGDVQKSFHASYLFLLQKIKTARTITELQDLHTQLTLIIRGLIGKHSNTKDLTKLLTLISDALMKRVIELGCEKLGTPPVSFSYIVLGSSGRGEQTLATDQDNAIVFADTDEETEELARQYFLQLGEIVASNLDRIGYDFCKGEIMASNPKWCQPVTAWKNYFTNWVTTSSPQDLLEVKIFFDLRYVYGEPRLVSELQNHITSITSGYNSFFVYLSESVLQFQMPEAALKLKSAIDIKMVMLPIVDAVRLYGLMKKCMFTGTVERLDFMYHEGAISRQAYKNILHVYSFLMDKRLEHQAELLVLNHKADNQINPLEFSDVEIVILKKSVAVIEELQNKLKSDFRGTVSI